MLEKINGKSKLIVAILFILMTLIGLLVTPNYGMPWDELMEIRTLGSSVREYVGLFQGEENEPETSTTGIVLTDVSKNPDVDHGQSVYYPLSPVLFADLGPSGGRTLMLIFHAYTFLIFMAGVVFLYFIAKFLTGDWKYGVVASLFMYLSPRFFAEGHYNSKDIMTMSVLIICFWFMIKFIETKKYRYATLFAAVCAIAANMRIVGLFFFGLAGLLYLICLTVSKQWNRKTFLAGVIAVFAFVLFYFLLTPAAWESPVEFIQYVFKRSSNYEDWPGYVFFQGISHRPVPWQYIPVMIAVTTPILILLLTIIGNITTIGQLFRTKVKELFAGNLKYYLLSVVFIWAFLGFAMIKKPILYDSWRHFYFLYGFFLLLAVGGLKCISDKLKGKVRWVVAGLVAIQLLACATSIVMNHPYQYVYFNFLAGAHPGENYEMDYWNVSQVNALIKLIDETDPEKKINLYAAEWCSYDGLVKAYNILPEEYKSRMQVLEIKYGSIPAEADYMMVSLRALQVSIIGATLKSSDWIYSNGLGKYVNIYPVAVSCDAYGSDFMTIYKLP
jgi:hypothetical protein